MIYISRCIKAGVRLPSHLTVALSAFVLLSASAYASNFMCQYPSTPPEGQEPVVDQPEEVKAAASEASQEALEGIVLLFEAMLMRERGDLDAYREVSEQAAEVLETAAISFESIPLADRESDLSFVRHLTWAPQVVDSEDGSGSIASGDTFDTRLHVSNLVMQISGSHPEPMERVSDLNIAVSRATAALAMNVREATEYDLSDPRFAAVRHQYAIYVYLGDVTSRIGDATYFRPIE